MAQLEEQVKQALSQVTFPGLGGSPTVLDMSAGHDHTCALIDDMANLKVFCWGRNSDGQIGNGTMTASVATPFELSLGAFLPDRLASSISSLIEVDATWTDNTTLSC